MEKLDRLGWAAGIAFTAYGVSVGVRVSDASVLEPLRALLPPGWKPAGKPPVRRLYSLIVGGPTSRPGVRRFNLLYSDAARLVRAHDLEATLRQLAARYARGYRGDGPSHPWKRPASPRA